MNHGERYRKRKVKVLRRQNPLVVQNDPRRKQNVDEQVEVSEEKRFVNPHLLLTLIFGIPKQINE